MSGFGNINDLRPSSQTPSAPLPVASADMEEKFTSKMGEIKRKELELETRRQADESGTPYINLERFPISQEALKQIPVETAKELGTVCFFVTPDEIRLGALNPKDGLVEQMLREIEDRNHASGAIYAISEASLERVIELYASLPVVKAISKDINITEEEIAAVETNVNDFASLQAALKKRTTTDVMTVVLGAALKLDSSDVHIEAEAERVAVRFRLDGVLHDAATLPKDVYKHLVSRIKLLSALKINITDKPQDGRFTIKLKQYDVDVRVSTIPTVYGESIVLRLLRQTQEGLTLDDLGIRGQALAVLKREIERPNGMIIVTGPTGSGKSTTLYAIIKILNKPGVKIVTLEDPVEYRIGGISQSQIEHSKEYTFAKGLRSILRQDPDIVMVGEIRDLETADIAVQAALTGHLLLSTIHTNNAAGSIPRFLSMGVKPFLLTPALNCVVGQRLARRVCPRCRQEKTLAEVGQPLRERVEAVLSGLPAAEAEKLAGKPTVVYAAAGCPECNNLGYKGRISICEVFTMIREIEAAITGGQYSEYEIANLAREAGMLTMVEDGILKALDGLTTPEEVFRVIE
ncbi:MAG: Type II secretion system protein E (GspE) [Candidatus Magasanikbacteria bacterium GW2011_GWA2_56_11]|uniref:Type II secretion system protein E (GspE) n=1 Tax=Candidatus Magasanikbacteria bacterium GW2011_GWA2_56_11 TaxID=1619044 RepID=A0A0G2BBG3_9BACT|nr:MAG: Type II secretion system protein E (GspE) [Candidatus Magasanikbacteria bacterium GW2011_GWA2_56_11]